MPWVLLLGFIGQQVGSRWEDWKDSLHYFDYAIAVAILAGIAYLLIRRRLARGADAPAA